MAYGDALGLPYEGLAAARARKLLGPPDRMRLFLGFSTISDDTEHAWLSVRAALISQAEPEAFACELRRSLKLWFLGLPPGIGMATAKACLRMWLGLPTHRCGIHSAGNGPGMRAVALGALLGANDRLLPLVDASTLLTHRDPRAIDGARMLALAAALSSQQTLQATALAERFAELGLPQDPAFRKQWQDSLSAAPNNAAISGFMPDTVCAVLATCLQYPQDLSAAVTALVLRGGDTDSTAAMAAAIIAANHEATLPGPDNIRRIVLWPLSATLFEQLGRPSPAPRNDPSPVPIIDKPSTLKFLIRNLGSWVIVLSHALRRCLPPY